MEDKKYTAQEAAIAVLKKAEEMLLKAEKAKKPLPVKKAEDPKMAPYQGKEEKQGWEKGKQEMKKEEALPALPAAPIAQKAWTKGIHKLDSFLHRHGKKDPTKLEGEKNPVVPTKAPLPDKEEKVASPISGIDGKGK